MSHVPDDTKWYIADLVEEIRIAGISGNAVHINSTLIRADSPDEAQRKALRFGKQSQTSYLNPSGKKVTIAFIGIAELMAVYEPLRDGAELLFQERRNLSNAALKKLIKPKKRLDVFVPPRPRVRSDFDYASGEVVREVLALLKRQKKRKERRARRGTS